MKTIGLHESAPEGRTEFANAGEEIRQFRDALSAEELLTDSLHEWGYELARDLADRALTKGDRIGQIASLLENSYDAAYPINFDYINSASFRGTHSEYDGVMGYNPDYLDQRHGEGEDQWRHVRALHPLDGRLINFLSVVGHEAGHALLAGISQVKGSYFPFEGSYATRRYLADHPEMGITGNWQTDYAIHEERFAEGYSQIVVEELLSELGYRPMDRIAIRRSMRHRIFSGGEWGTNQIDYLQKAGALASPSDLVQTPNELQTYEGRFGYAIPLNRRQLRAQLMELSAYEPDPAESEAEVMARPWERAVNRERSLSLRSYRKQMELVRVAHLNQRNLHKMAGAAATAAFAAGGFLGYATLKADNPSDSGLAHPISVYKPYEEGETADTTAPVNIHNSLPVRITMNQNHANRQYHSISVEGKKYRIRIPEAILKNGYTTTETNHIEVTRR